MDNNPYKIIYCVKNNNKIHQYYHYIFLGNVNQSIKTVINKFTNLSLSDTIDILTDKDLNTLIDFYGNRWFKYFFNKEHIDFSLSSSNPKSNAIIRRLKLEHTKKEYKPQFTYGFNTHRSYINNYLKHNRHVIYGGNEESEFNVDFNLDDIVNQIKENERMQVNQDNINKLLNEREHDIIDYNNIEDNDEDNDEEVIRKLDDKEMKQINNEIKKTKDIIKFNEYQFNTSKDDNEYDDNLYDSFNKIYVYDIYINNDDTIKEIKNKISLTIKNRNIYQSQNILPSRMYLWIRWLVDEKKDQLKKDLDIDKYNSLHYLINSSQRKEEDICLSDLWLENNDILRYSIKPYSHIDNYLNITKEVIELNNKVNNSTIRILRKSLENNILSSMLDYLENNDIFMIDVYNEINYINNITNDQIHNLQNTFLKIYFPNINSNEITQILAFINNGFSDNKNIDAEKEVIKINNEYKELYLENSLTFKIENIYHDIFKDNKQYINNVLMNDNNIMQVQLEVKLQSDDLLHFRRLELYKIFDNFKLNNKYVFLQYTQSDNTSIYKFDEEAIDNLISNKDLYVNIVKWFNMVEYGLIFRINYSDNYVPVNIFIDVVGRMVIKFYWKEENNITIDKIKDFYYVARDLIKEINNIIDSKITIPDDDHFKILFITSLKKFTLSNNKEINHNKLSNFSRLFYPYFSVVIDPKKRTSTTSSSNFSKYGTYLRYKRINDYENEAKIENRIKYCIKYIDITTEELINEISRQYNLTPQKAKYYYDNVINKYPNIKKKSGKLKSYSELGKDKMDGVDISIQGKDSSNYKIIFNGVRSFEQLEDINNIIRTLLFLYDELYNKSTNKFKYLIDVLNKINNVAERRNYVIDYVNYSTNKSDIKEIQNNDNIYVGYNTGKGITTHSRLCQNSGTDNRRRPLQFTDNNIGELIKDGYKLNNSTGMYEKKTTYEGKEITLRVVKLKGNNNSSVYYTCTPENNGRHTYIGFLTKGRNPLGKYPPCCFRTDGFISNNKSKKEFNFNQLKDNNNEFKRSKELTYNEIYYILADIVKVPDNRIAFMPDIMNHWINKDKSFKIVQHILTKTNDYYFKMGCNNDSTIKGANFFNCVCKALNKSYDELFDECIININDNDLLFTYINNGDIKNNFIQKENYIKYLQSKDYRTCDIIDLVSYITSTNIYVFEKVIVNDVFRWDIKYKYINNENDYSYKNNIFIIEQDNTYTLIVNVKKDHKNSTITKLFTDNDYIVQLNKSLFKDNHNYKYHCAKDVNKHINIIGQDVDINNKCNYVINENGLIVPVVNGGIIINTKIVDINKYLKSYDETIKLMKDKEFIKYLIYDKHNDKGYRIRGIGIDNELVIPIIKYYTKSSKYKLVNQPSYVKLDKLIQDKNNRHEIKKDERIKIVNAMKYKSEAYELFRYNLCYYFKSHNKDKDKILDIINNNIDDKVNVLRKVIYEIINNEKANKFYYNKTKEKIVSNNKPLIYVYSDINLDDYEVNNNREVSEVKNKLQCTSKHEFYDNGRCMFSLSINLLIEFINRLTYELIGNELKRCEVLRINGHKVSSVVNDNYFSQRENEKILKRKTLNDNNPFIEYYKNRNKYIPQTKKRLREKKKVVEYVKPFKQNGKMNQQVYNVNAYLRAIVNSIYYYKYKINLGYYNEIQDTLINNLIGDIINYVIDHNINNQYEFINTLTSNSDLIDYKVLYNIVSDIYQLTICVYDNNNKVLYSNGKTNQLNILIDDNMIFNIF